MPLQPDMLNYLSKTPMQPYKFRYYLRLDPSGQHIKFTSCNTSNINVAISHNASRDRNGPIRYVKFGMTIRGHEPFRLNSITPTDGR